MLNNMLKITTCWLEVLHRKINHEQKKRDSFYLDFNMKQNFAVFCFNKSSVALKKLNKKFIDIHRKC